MLMTLSGGNNMKEKDRTRNRRHVNSSIPPLKTAEIKSMSELMHLSKDISRIEMDLERLTSNINRYGDRQDDRFKGITKSISDLKENLDYVTPMSKHIEDLNNGVKKSLDEKFQGKTMTDIDSRISVLTGLSILNASCTLIVLVLFICNIAGLF